MFYQKNSLVSSDCLDCPHPGLASLWRSVVRGGVTPLDQGLRGESLALLSIDSCIIFIFQTSSLKLNNYHQTFSDIYNVRGLSLFLLGRWVWVKEIRPVPEVKSNEYCWQQNQGSLVNDSDKFRLGVGVQEEDCTELHQLQEDEDDAGDHPHVQAGHVGHPRYRPGQYQ